LASDYYQRFVGRPLEVLIEGLVDSNPGWVHGTDRHYIPVQVCGTARDVGTFRTCVGTEVAENFLRAE
jgi:threonylcarbamoyladenosine tRNA methylthiotransferase MtaB